MLNASENLAKNDEIKTSFKDFTNLQQSLNETIKLHLTIIADFWSNFSPQLLHNWHNFFASSNKLTLQDIDNEIINFVHNALNLLKFE